MLGERLCDQITGILLEGMDVAELLRFLESPAEAGLSLPQGGLPPPPR
jgi:hypothetical protein